MTAPIAPREWVDVNSYVTFGVLAGVTWALTFVGWMALFAFIGGCDLLSTHFRSIDLRPEIVLFVGGFLARASVRARQTTPPGRTAGQT